MDAQAIPYLGHQLAADLAGAATGVGRPICPPGPIGLCEGRSGRPERLLRLLDPAVQIKVFWRLIHRRFSTSGPRGPPPTAHLAIRTEYRCRPGSAPPSASTS